jgi:enoyl-CoA hydratase/carnithine racemase
MKWIEAETDDGVTILKLNHGITNAINGELVKELRESLRHLQGQSEVKALVLTSANEKFFSIGFDLPELFSMTPGDFEEFFTGYNHLCLELYTLPRPTVAALTGHTIAGGFILASCCDYRFFIEGKKYCALNEVNLGVPVPFLADLVLRQLVGDRQATEIMYTGRLITAEEALRMGYVDALFPPDQIRSQALNKARFLGNLPAEALRRIKENRTAGLAGEIRGRLEEDIKTFLKFWYMAEARERLKEAIKKF